MVKKQNKPTLLNVVSELFALQFYHSNKTSTLPSRCRIIYILIVHNLLWINTKYLIYSPIMTHSSKTLKMWPRRIIFAIWISTGSDAITRPMNVMSPSYIYGSPWLANSKAPACRRTRVRNKNDQSSLKYSTALTTINSHCGPHFQLLYSTIYRSLFFQVYSLIHAIWGNSTYQQHGHGGYVKLRWNWC